MQIGFNNDVEYRGKTFHIQTEDHGENDPRIETQLFHSGAILDTVFTSYEEILEEYDGAEAKERIRAQMKASHRSLYKKLLAGEYDELAGLDPVSDPEEVAAPDPDEFMPSQERVPAAAAQVEQKAEEEGEDAILEFQKKKAKNHVSLDKLKNQLSKIDEEDESADGADEADAVAQTLDGEEDAAPTEVLESNEAGLEFSSMTDDAEEAEDTDAPSEAGEVEKTSEPAAGASAVAWEKTGARAWRGCEPAADPLSLTELVEDFLAR